MITEKSSHKSRSKEAYFTAFIRLWNQKNFEDITVQEIITESTYCKAGFYRVFHDKYDLAEQLFHEAAIYYIDSIISGLSLYNSYADKLEGKRNIVYQAFHHIRREI